MGVGFVVCSVCARCVCLLWAFRRVGWRVLVISPPVLSDQSESAD